MYRNAHWFVLIIALATLSGFVPTYFLNFDAVLPRHHIHMATALCWMLLLFVQPLLASRGKFGLHRVLGWSSVVVFPLLAATSAYIVWYASGVDVVKGGVYPKLYWFDYWMLPVMIGLWIAGIVWRKDVAIHQRCMLLTLVVLAPPGYGRAIFFYILHPMGGSFHDTWHPLILPLLAVLGFMLYREKNRFWPTRIVFILVLAIYLSSFLIADAQWWIDFVTWFANPDENYMAVPR